MRLSGTDAGAASPLSLEFSKLEALRIFCQQNLAEQVTSLDYFAYDVGFQHFRGKQPRISVSSSATCVLSLVATGAWAAKNGWNADKLKTKALLQALLARTKSAGLNDYNPFTIAWILEAVTSLEDASTAIGQAAKIRKLEGILQRSLKTGGVSIEPYPASAYLTQLVVRVLRRRRKLTSKLTKAAKGWAWAELARQLALLQAKSKTADAFAVAYLIMLVTAVTPTSETSPEQSSILQTALQAFFACQLEDGTWPLSRPLFHYPNFGNAYCYEYEMLVQLLQERELQDLLLDYLPQLTAAAKSISYSVYRIKAGVQAWTSGHHPNQAEPESWTTASVYHFLHELDRLLAEAVRRELFHYLEAPLPPPGIPKQSKSQFAEEFLDSRIKVQGRSRSLRKFLWEEFLFPLTREADDIAIGRKFDKRTARSAIFFGPPGTSKTELSNEIARFLGWPLLAIDPSPLLSDGMDAIQAEANVIFRMLEQTERVVVLFDEFDELVRERESSNVEAFSRFLTTAMLPKLASIHKRATLIFILATNNIGAFDIAIRRQGRFDHVIQIMPPTFEAKIRREWGSSKIDIGKKLSSLSLKLDPKIKQKIADLTFGECDEFASELAETRSRKAALSLLDRHWSRCTLQMHIPKTVIDQEDGTTWKERCKQEAVHNR